MNIAIFGGSFDPPHLGHDKIVKELSKNSQIDNIIVIPTFISPFKNSFNAPPKLRLKWVNELWGSIQGVSVSDYEISQNRPVASIQTARHFKKLLNPSEIYLIIGADHLKTLHLWDDIEELKKLVKFIVATRDNINLPKNLQKLDINVNISSSLLRQNLDENLVPQKIRDEVIKFYKGNKMLKKIELITDILENKKVENIEVVDMRDKDYLTNFVIIATTLAAKQAFMLVDEIKLALKNHGETFINIESSDDWTVIDLGEIMIHLMSESYRAKYNLEEFLNSLHKEPQTI
ncbi:MAG: nicotinate (nicotinamide) nucleotide adenylyltransferase [Campylobacter sp.]|nr:nicotinate (nicotinamide) nucleotide adenylyltransferase [Campylobacter sp.]